MKALDQQIAEKKVKEEEEKAKEKAYLLKQTRDTEIAKKFERQIEEVSIMYSIIFNNITLHSLTIKSIRESK